MPASLQYKKIYVDTKFRSQDSNSSSDFKIELPETITFQENTVFYLDDITIPHSWDTILTDINDKLYFKVYVGTGPTPSQEYHFEVSIEAGNYIGPDLATEIQTKMNDVTTNVSTNLFTCAYVPKTNKITISIKNDPAVYSFRIPTQRELPTMEWFGSIDRSNPHDINDILSNLDGVSTRNFTITPFISGALYLQPFNNIYIHASNLGNYNTIGCQNERTIVKKVPVSADRGMQIFDQCVLMNDYNDCSGQTIKTLYFQLKSVRGDIIPLNGCNWSFSIVFSRNNPDL